MPPVVVCLTGSPFPLRLFSHVNLRCRYLSARHGTRAKNGLEQEVSLEYYVPMAQLPAGNFDVLRTTTNPASLANAMRKAVLCGRSIEDVRVYNRQWQPTWVVYSPQRIVNLCD